MQPGSSSDAPERTVPESTVPEPTVPEPTVPEPTVPEPTGAEPDGAAAWRERTFRTLLESPHHRVSALDSEGFQIAVPASARVPEDSRIAVPEGRVTMLDLFIPADRLPVVRAWERAGVDGHATETVRLVHDPDRVMVLTLLNLSDLHGVWMGVLTESPDSPAVDRTPSALATIRPRLRTAVLTKNRHAVILAVDDRVPRMLGWTTEQLVGKRSSDFVHPGDADRTMASWLDLLATREPQRVRFRHRCADSSWLWVEAEHTLAVPVEGSTPVVTTQLDDISEEMAAYEAVAERERLFSRLTEALPVGVLRIDPSGVIGVSNAYISGMFGGAPLTTVEALVARAVPEDRDALGAAIAAAVGGGGDQSLEVGIRRSGTVELRRCAVSLIALTDREGAAGALACLQDVTDSVRLRDDLRIRATFDGLTGAHNRSSVLAAVDRSLETAPAGSTGVVFIDLDRFKEVNDHWGHAIGDELLVHVAQQLAAVVRPRDIVGRLGGDEFLVVLHQIDGPDDALTIADRISEAVHRSVVLAGKTVHPGASIGVACSLLGDSGKALVARADAAMYQSKQGRAGRPVVDRG